MAAWSRKYRWPLALLAVLVMGYSLGKDMAVRDNRADALAAKEL